MKFNKVVYLAYFPLTQRTYTNFYFEELLQNKIQVEYLDITHLFYPDKIKMDSLDYEVTVKITSYKHLKDYLKEQNKSTTLYISIMTFEWRVFRLFRILTKYNINLGVFGAGVFPNSSIDNKSRVIRFLKAISFERVKSLFANKLILFCKKRGFIKTYDYIFMAGEYGYWGLGIGSEIDVQKAKIIRVNTVDYDQFILHKKLPPVNDEEYIVFLDQYLPYHPDASYFNIKTVEPEPYFKEVNGYFDRLELATGKKVIIAAHPKAERYKEFNPYNGRPIFFNHSNDLVKEASLVLTHASTAVCFPICYKKKIVLLVSDYLNEVLPQFLMVAKSIENACDATIVKMDNEEEIYITEIINTEKYSDFKYKYLTSKESENQLSKDIFMHFLKSEDKSPQ
ncbi:hypothetical protein [Flavobacterium succinicans]|uniref:Uncharacterized protein n=1 Tax=Flavobacterium succinicans TaxID=29536 RepID=A0A199XMZ5_9FLAO|nr:hypothetical protein [Flavobacterium succinicans]OAZ03103.1 hypothetical protein FLB_23490 [Flavobacterium succinicans]